MKIGLDLDGVIANFYKAYEELTIEVAGEDLFQEHRWPNEVPCVWNWPEHYGYSSEVMREVWRRISEDPLFWFRLEPLPGALDTVGPLIANAENDVYYITARPGLKPRAQSQAWLMYHLEDPCPTVLITEDKGCACRCLDLDVYVDDKLSNIMSVANLSDRTQAFLVDRPYNQCDPSVHFKRVSQIQDVFCEGHLREKEC